MSSNLFLIADLLIIKLQINYKLKINFSGALRALIIKKSGNRLVTTFESRKITRPEQIWVPIMTIFYWVYLPSHNLPLPVRLLIPQRPESIYRTKVMAQDQHTLC